MAKGTLKIHSENILPIIKKWLYSERDIFLRELVSNACDAIQKLKILRDSGEANALDEEFKIEISIDAQNRCLRIADTGIGMDAEEVEKYIAQIAFSGAEEFVQKYSAKGEEEQIIGHFGLGFYSAYMVATTVEIQTLSYKNAANPVHWVCDGSSEYTLEEGSRTTRGTEITLHLNDDSAEYLERGRLKELLNRYSAFLPYPIFLDGEQVNEEPPLWIKSATDCSEKDYLRFYQKLHPGEQEPLFWVHLNVDYPFRLKGILYFPKVHRDFDFNQSAIKLFCNRVFVSDNCKDLLPEYLTMLRGAIDSPDIPLNVSRSYLQMDRTVRQLGTHISKKVADRLVALYQQERERFLAGWRDIEAVVKLGAMQDDKFYERIKECLVWKTGTEEWVTLDEYLERTSEKQQSRVFYAEEERQSSQILSLYREKGLEVLFTHGLLDTHFVSFLERKLSGVKFQRVDGGVDPALLDPAREKTLLDADGRTEASRLSDYVKGILGIEVEAKSLSSDGVPALIVLDEQARRLRDYLMVQNPNGKLDSSLAEGGRRLVLNTNNHLVAAIQSLRDKQPDLAKDLLHQVYDMALLGQREMRPEGIDRFIDRSHRVLERLASLAAS